MSDSLQPSGLSALNSPGQNTGVGSLSILQGIFPTWGLKPGLPLCGWILYQLSHKGSPRILGCLAYPFSRGSSQPRNQTGVSCMAGGFFTNWAVREARNQTLAASLLRLETPSLPTCYPLIPPFSFRRIMLPREKGRRSRFITPSQLTRGVVLKLVRQHIILILLLRISDPGAPSSSWRNLQQ